MVCIKYKLKYPSDNILMKSNNYFNENLFHITTYLYATIQLDTYSNFIVETIVRVSSICSYIMELNDFTNTKMGCQKRQERVICKI